MDMPDAQAEEVNTVAMEGLEAIEKHGCSRSSNLEK